MNIPTNRTIEIDPAHLAASQTERPSARTTEVPAPITAIEVSLHRDCDDASMTAEWAAIAWGHRRDYLREQRVRRRARRQGLLAVRSRRDGSYCLRELNTSSLVCSGDSNGFGLNLDEIERSLDEGEV